MTRPESHVATAAYDCLRRHHNHFHHELWNVTTGKMVGDLHMTPRDAFSRSDRIDPPDGHDDWFPRQIGEILARTEGWCDVLSLAPPDGLFLKAFKKALYDICTREVSLGRVTIRMMFGNVVGMPVNCNKLIEELTKDLPRDASSKLKLWVGSWRKGVSWNHAKIIAVDGKHLWTGGHNFWDAHYLKKNPTNDLSLEMQGGVARDAHRFANAQWGYIVKKQSTAWGRFVDKRIPDALDVPRKARVTVSEFPTTNAAEFPPYWKLQNKQTALTRRPKVDPDMVPVITMGRYGVMLKKHRPSDDAFIAMFDSAQHIIRLALQDLGPPMLPRLKVAIPGFVWPKEYLRALARALWIKGVDIEIVLSNPYSIPNDLPSTEANYGNGFSCVDVAAEIIKAIKDQYPEAHDGDLRLKVQENLRVCYVKCPKGGNHYSDGGSLGLHSKHFIVDDVATYIGSQNLYICDLAEWGVLIDSPESVAKIKAQYWDPMWKVSYTSDDCNVDKVMDGLKIDRSAPSKVEMTKIQLQEAKERIRATHNLPSSSLFHAKPPADGEDSMLSESTVSDGEVSETEEC